MAQQPGSADGAALDVLRGIWTARRQTAADLQSAPSNAKVCRNMKNIGFGGRAGDSATDPVEEDQRQAWRARLAREGKLVPGARSVRELLLGPEAPTP